MREIRATLREALLAGGSVLRECFGRVTYRLKGRANLVTAADLRSQKKVISIIRRAFPGHAILAEEAAQGPARSRGPRSGADGGGPLWVIDPLDGTTNYAHTFPAAAVSIAFVDKGRVAAGGVMDPFREEMFTAERGRGSFLNGKRIRVSSVPSLSRALLVTGFPYDRAE